MTLAFDMQGEDESQVWASHRSLLVPSGGIARTRPIPDITGQAEISPSHVAFNGADITYPRCGQMENTLDHQQVQAVPPQSNTSSKDSCHASKVENACGASEPSFANAAHKCCEPGGGMPLLDSDELPLVSILMPMYNAAEFLDDMMASLLAQTYEGQMELIVYNDGPSTDVSMEIIERYRESLVRRFIALKIEEAKAGAGLRGCGYGRNLAARLSKGTFLCFADADDIMFPRRIELQVELARQNPCLLVGANFVRLPPEATPRFTAWANSLSQAQLYTQQLLETTILTPTWLCSRALFETVGPFDEGGPGTPDDLMFFYRHLALGGLLAKVEEPLVVYRFHGGSVTGSRGVAKERIWAVRLAHLEAHLLPHSPWAEGFTIWNAGKEGRRLYRSLSPANQQKVAAFCDVDARKIARGHYCHVDSGRSVPVLHWQRAVPPLLLCVKRGLGNDEFESNVASLNLREGVDYVFFS